MTVHNAFSILAVAAYIVFFVLAIYAIKKKKSLPMVAALVVAQLFNLLTSLTAY